VSNEGWEDVFHEAPTAWPSERSEHCFDLGKGS
jgi:hypothetical protein